MVEKKGMDMAEILDEIVQQDRYGKRNYRNSIGADSRRHWRGTFLVTETSVEAEVDEDQLGGFMDRQFDGLQEAKDAADQPDEQAESKGMFVPDVPVVDKGAAYNIAEPVADQSTEDLNDSDEQANFFDPLANVDQLDEVLKSDGELESDDPSENLYGTAPTTRTDDFTASADSQTTSDTDETDETEDTGEVDAS